MDYIEMSVNNALKVLGEDGNVLVAVQNLGNEREILSFDKMKKSECRELIKDAKSIKNYDDFVRKMIVEKEKENVIILY